MTEIILIALSLTMDAFAVSVSSAACTKNLRKKHMLRAALAFGVFQGAMPLAGWFAGYAFIERISHIDHWIAFGLLFLIGGKMLIEAAEDFVKHPKPACPTEAEKKKRDLSSKRVLIALAIATSIDALAVGMSFAVIRQPILLPSAVIGFVTALVCGAGFIFGKRIGLLFGRFAQIAGGLTLIAIGARILAAHLRLGI